MLFDGKEAASFYKEEVKKEVEEFKKQGINPKIVILQAQYDEASEAYLKGRRKLGSELGVEIECQQYEGISQEDLIKEIEKYNKNKNVAGIMVDRPLPKDMDENEVYSHILLDKDIDGCNPKSLEALEEGRGFLTSSTPQAVIDLIDYYKIELKGLKVTVVGRSKNVGAPLAILLRQRGAIVTVCHSKTVDVKGDCKAAELVIVAMGKKEYIDHEYVTEKTKIIDVGIHRGEDGKLCGDVSKEVYPLVDSYSPVPGGVGPLTNVALFRNTIKALRRQINGK